MKRYLYITLIILFIVFGLYIFKLTTYTYISAKFKELRPIHHKLSVYYKGLVVGKAKEMKHSSNFEHTIIKIVLYPKKLLLPVNTTVLLKREKKNDKEWDFLELVYPKEPSNVMISNGSELEGIATVDLETFAKNQNPDDLEAMKENLANSIMSLSYAMDTLNQMFTSANEILQQNKPNIYKTTGNIESVTAKFDNSIDSKQLDNTMSNIGRSTKEIAEVISETNNSIPAALDNTECLVDNLNAISCGIRKTLGKKAGGLRLFFGKVIDE